MQSEVLAFISRSARAPFQILEGILCVMVGISWAKPQTTYYLQTASADSYWLWHFQPSKSIMGTTWREKSYEKTYRSYGSVYKSEENAF